MNASKHSRPGHPANPVPEVPATERAAALAAGVDPDNVGFAVLQLIQAYGVDTVFGIPGTHNLEFYRHLNRLGIHAVTSRHEQGAGYAADGWSQRTRLPGVVITTSGPGLLNALSAAGTAYCESRPMLILAPGVARGAEFADIGALHETKDQRAAAAAIVEWARRVDTAQEAVDAVHDAFELFRTGRPRPVYIEIPLDVLEAAAEVDPASLLPRPAPAPQPAEESAVAAAAKVLLAAKRPAILAGGGAIPGAAALRELAERLGAPVVTSLNGKGVLPESHPLSLGSELRLETAREVLNNSDALLVVGSKIGESELWGGQVATQGDVIRVDILASQRDKNLAATHALIGDSAVVLPQLVSALGSGSAAPALDLDAVRAASRAEGAAFAPLESKVAERIARALPSDAIVTGDSSQITYYGMTSAVRAEQPGSFMYMAAYATLGYGLPAAIGAKLASPERPVVGVIGDGALMFSVQEFQTAIEQGIDITIVCVDNGGYGEIQQNEADRGIAPVGVVLSQPDWAKLVDAFGGTGFSVRAANDLESVLEQAISHTGVSLVHVPLRLFA
ncbi:thiamine pyrophosphate-binding protein [Leucobacter insecticola]|uniref:Thiamine pyrophosphate-binding protein n=1 Tax=Leucobacter insecticola TaxID=2714934 RepID=A0A6G8FI02_9MICO|nr:thiamine pyrophosphate-binding protein [Leucobacter insecticola]QIM15981.1 thiamine pyrophosphate-binding protein [Leucobacter insecticola]